MDRAGRYRGSRDDRCDWTQARSLKWFRVVSSVISFFIATGPANLAPALVVSERAGELALPKRPAHTFRVNSCSRALTARRLSVLRSDVFG